MQGLNLIKDELLKQKEIIESRSGTVTVANLNPSPAEITEGIKTIPSHDLSVSTATEADVKQGKTFFSGNAILKTGTAIIDQQATDSLFMAPAETVNYNGEIYYTFPTGTIKTRKYLFYSNHNSVTITFNDDIEHLEEYSFFKAINFKFENFNELKNIKQLGANCFAQGSTNGIDLGRLPNSIKSIGSYAFYYAMQDGLDIVLPEEMTLLGQYSFMAKNRVYHSGLNFSNLKYNTLPTYCFYNNVFNCDCIVPEAVTSIATYFNYNGCFKNIEIHANIRSINSFAFGANSAHSVSDYFLKTVTFKGVTPPSISTQPFARQNIENGLKIYVPDESVEAYKAVSNLSSYLDCIKPMSEKE